MPPKPPNEPDVPDVLCADGDDDGRDALLLFDEPARDEPPNDARCPPPLWLDERCPPPLL